MQVPVYGILKDMLFDVECRQYIKKAIRDKNTVIPYKGKFYRLITNS